MAKGVEDTAYYRYSRFIALNEVGGDPGQFGIPLQDFHALQASRLDRLPASMTSLTTHDTKRGEDVRARLAALSEIPELLGRVCGAVLEHDGNTESPLRVLPRPDADRRWAHRVNPHARVRREGHA